MGYRFETGDRTVQAAVRRIAAEQAANARRALGDTGLPMLKRVHEARKAAKKLRALIRLVRPGFAGFDAENAALREIGRVLSPLRDAGIASGLLDRLAETAGVARPEAGVLAAMVGAHIPSADLRRIDAADAALDDLEVRARRWQVSGRGFAALRGGLIRSREAGRDAMRAALKDITPETVHRWRKRIKDHWYHACLLEPIWPEGMVGYIGSFDRLGELLGDHQDMIVLGQRLIGAEPADAAAAILGAAKTRRDRLLAEAGPLSRRLYAEPAAALADRWDRWWSLACPALPSR